MTLEGTRFVSSSIDIGDMVSVLLWVYTPILLDVGLGVLLWFV